MLSDGVVGLFVIVMVMMTRMNSCIPFVVKGAGKNLFLLSRDFGVNCDVKPALSGTPFMTWRP